ncbi:TetR/AcrR family transcriptional regulator [Streptomyces ficellus]|uniref:TetR/AcrR family transcriptional regulator n=1 Tax=Streptomyces ficellus TaxID=1977088 RepID=A0A6I6F0X6_9ACTN|nr:TetR/AcrR family transcriptional regulator [Streptomyces ficellus]QGV77300.1 TetR/AcrR family transcriptional regulator [Streptomyces ficellus]
MSTQDRRTLIADAAIATVAEAGLRGLTHRAVDAAAGLPAGSTSYYFRTRTALIEACYQRLAERDLADVDLDAWPPPEDAVDRDTVDRDAVDREGVGRVRRAMDRDRAAAVLAQVLHHWLTAGRDRTLARIELTLEAARQPQLRPSLHQAGAGPRERAAAILTALGATRPEYAAGLLVAWTEGLLYEWLVGASASVRPVPELPELTSVVRRMLDAALAEDPGGHSAD